MCSARTRQYNKCDSGVVGNARPCQGRDRGFEPRLSLFATKRISDRISFFVARSEEEPLTRGASSCLRFAPVGAKQTSTGRLAPVYRSLQRKRISDRISFFCCKERRGAAHPRCEFSFPLRSGRRKAKS